MNNSFVCVMFACVDRHYVKFPSYNHKFSHRLHVRICYTKSFPAKFVGTFIIYPYTKHRVLVPTVLVTVIERKIKYGFPKSFMFVMCLKILS
jgi:hypothetical protein